MFAINRYRDKWDKYHYECSICKRYNETISEIDHKNNCPVKKPDEVNMIVSESTERQIEQLLIDIEWLYEKHEYVYDFIEEFKSKKGVRWVDSGSSSRFVIGIGKTSKNGEFHLKDKRGIVIKFDPHIRYNKNHTSVSGNIDELLNWNKAVKTNTKQYFADIISCSKDGMWLIMEECIPIHLARYKIKDSRDSLYDKNNEYIYPLINELKNNNWENPDYKHGNIGLNHKQKPVLLDYGTGPNYIE